MSDRPYQVEDAPAAAQQRGGVTLIDMLVAMAASWALPSVGNALGVGRLWIVLLAAVNAIPAMLWAFYSKRLVRYLFIRGRDQARQPTAIVVADVALILLLTATLQYAVYVIILNVARLFV